MELALRELNNEDEEKFLVVGTCFNLNSLSVAVLEYKSTEEYVKVKSVDTFPWGSDTENEMRYIKKLYHLYDRLGVIFQSGKIKYITTVVQKEKDIRYRGLKARGVVDLALWITQGVLLKQFKKGRIKERITGSMLASNADFCEALSTYCTYETQRSTHKDIGKELAIGSALAMLVENNYLTTEIHPNYVGKCVTYDEWSRGQRKAKKRRMNAEIDAQTGQETVQETVQEDK